MTNNLFATPSGEPAPKPKLGFWGQILPANFNVLLCWIVLVAGLIILFKQIGKVNQTDLRQAKIMDRLEKQKASKDDLAAVVKVQQEANAVLQSKIDALGTSQSLRDKNLARTLSTMSNRLKRAEAREATITGTITKPPR